MTVLVLSTADWDASIWTNKQHVASRLAAMTDVIYVDSLGLRRPRLSTSDAMRVCARLRAAVAPTTSGNNDLPPGLLRVSPPVLPWHGAVASLVNRPVVWRAVHRWLALPWSQRLMWTFSPVTYGLEDRAAKCIYHCVDILEEFDGVDRMTVRRGEELLAKKGVAAVASSQTVADHLATRGFADIRVWENVADVTLFAAQRHTRSRVHGSLVFAGNLHSQKVDFCFLDELLNQLAEAQLTLVGPIADRGARDAVRRLLRSRRAIHIPAVSQRELSDIFSSAVVGLIPYRVDPYTRGVLPMKLYEYLASGLSVVATPLPTLSGRPGVHIVDSTAEAASVTRMLISPPTARDIDARYALAAAYSWEARVRQVAALLEVSCTAGVGNPEIERKPAEAWT